ncbi:MULTISPECIES: MerR family transcriptional regulator [Streptomyces]|uniref:HTH-type transcriptional activator TipA n=3 Tax=Streptomyces TaxID=1883 RepID=A0A6A0CUE4_9ACTN|nr:MULTISPECIES: MerR family transcriptional regulator [Streptomyces]NEE49304.1 MerR family transcriptional regulator [Streptomyces sp. SID8455]MDQ0294388.1 DNA-binding transcriptional MerR regulator [Streptomyces sp. DSM 41037]PJM83212.1 MerR family transcriptional regulator [Streptomyces sp. TSRI0384-2]QNE81781.1 MerR family transcriptional regulator [Streptomyces rutgersensis]RPK90904.1 HTH-type transcriptional activator TipA [Streptomyces sp. ADI98-12]
MEHTVGEVAAVAGVTVRTLHHYDAVGLLSPSGRSRAGHRRYGDRDLDRLQRILFHRALGFPLDEIAALLDDPAADPRAHLRRQHALLTDRIETLRRMADAVAAAMEAAQMGINLTPEEKFEVFEGFDPDRYADEAEQRWGHTEAYRASQRRTAAYTKADWQRLKDEFDALHARVAGLLERGVPAGAPEAMDAAEEHRRYIDSAHYPCDVRTHTGLADMYVADPRFTATYEAVRPGLARYLHDAIHANARRAEQPHGVKEQ